MSVVLSGVLLSSDVSCRVSTTGFARDRSLRQELDSQPVSYVLICFSGSNPLPVRITIIINII